MNTLSKKLRSGQRGQAILLIALAMVGLAAFVGLVVDVGVMFIQQAKLSRGIDAGAIAAAQQFRRGFQGADLASAAQNFLLLNDTTADHINIYRCKEPDPNVADGTLHEQALCTTPRRKLIRVEADRYVPFSFLRIVGIPGTTIHATGVGEAASIDLTLVIDTSASMSYETGGDPNWPDSNLDDPSVCNTSTTAPCQPLANVKDVAVNFLDSMFFPYDRVSVVVMTSQTPGGTRDHATVLPLTDNEATVTAAIRGLKVFQPPNCNTNPTAGPCINYNASTGAYVGLECPVLRSTGDPSSCNSSNIGGSLLRAGGELTRPPRRDEALWIIILLAGGPANATDTKPSFPYGYCPPTTWNLTVGPYCRDALSSTRHGNGNAAYDSDDYARDQADFIAEPTHGQGITVFTIGLGSLVRNSSVGDADAGEQLLTYIAETAGGTGANHGFYSYAPTTAQLGDIFADIAKSIFTRIAN